MNDLSIDQKMAILMELDQHTFNGVWSEVYKLGMNAQSAHVKLGYNLSALSYNTLRIIGDALHHALRASQPVTRTDSRLQLEKITKCHAAMSSVVDQFTVNYLWAEHAKNAFTEQVDVDLFMGAV